VRGARVPVRQQYDGKEVAHSVVEVLRIGRSQIEVA
jgi:hypothetical protein